MLCVFDDLNYNNLATFSSIRNQQLINRGNFISIVGIS